jgi:hypothetical protein
MKRRRGGGEFFFSILAFVIIIQEMNRKIFFLNLVLLSRVNSFGVTDEVVTPI